MVSATVKLVAVAVVALLVGVAAGYAVSGYTIQPAVTTVTKTSTITQTITASPLTLTQTVTQTAGTITLTEIATKTVTQPTTLTQTVTQPITTTVTAAAPSGLPDVIKIGVLCDLSGPIGPVGAHFYQGAHLAAKIVNDTGGIGGKPIKIIIEDTKTDAQAALDAARKLIEVDGVQVLVGPITSVATLTVAKYVNDRKVPTIATISSAAKITELGDDYVFRVQESEVHQLRAVVDLIKFFNFTKVLTFVVSDDWGIGMETYLKQKIPDRIISSIRVDPKKADFRSELVAAKAANPEAVFWGIWIENAKIIFRQAAEVGLTGLRASLSTNTLYNPVLYEDPRVAEFVITNPLYAENKASMSGVYTYETFRSMFKQIYKEEPWEPGAKLYYDATMLAIMAIAKAGVYDGAKIKQAITQVSQNLMGASGLLALDENGDPAVGPDYDWFTVVKTSEGQYGFQKVATWNSVAGIRWLGR
ncbi:MAG: ABC transporter substrate-binding protein [Nitrososphaerales archaeon]